jgi:hypothetical protein
LNRFLAWLDAVFRFAVEGIGGMGISAVMGEGRRDATGTGSPTGEGGGTADGLRTGSGGLEAASETFGAFEVDDNLLVDDCLDLLSLLVLLLVL